MNVSGTSCFPVPKYPGFVVFSFIVAAFGSRRRRPPPGPSEATKEA